MYVHLLFYLFSFATIKAGSPQQHMPITVGLLPNLPCQICLWVETVAPTGNPHFQKSIDLSTG